MNRRQFGRSVAAAAAGSMLDGSALLDGARALPSSEDRDGAGPTVSVMLWTILPKEPFERRIGVVAEAGYRSVELDDEFEQWSREDYERFRATRDKLGISVDAICLDRPGVANPATAAEFLQGLENRMQTAAALSCRDIIVLSGPQLPDVGIAGQRSAAIDVLKRGGDLAAKRGCRLLLESLDPEEAPHCFLNSVSAGFEIVRAVGNPHVRMVYDFYHEQIAGGNLIKKLTDNIDLVGLVHVADVPGRHDIGTGEINYEEIFRRLAQLGYPGAIAMEFLPADSPARSLRRAREIVERCYQRQGKAEAPRSS
jgi:hydroxypyruvate isomerase